MGKQWKQWQTFFFLGSRITADGGCSHEIKRCLLLGRKAMTNLDSILKSRDFALPIMVCIVKAGFSSTYVQMWELNHKVGWALKNWCFWAVMLEKICESPLDSKNIQSVNPEGNESLNIHWKDWGWSWSSVFWPPDVKSWFIRKDPDAGQDWRQKGTAGAETVGWHYQLNGHEFEQTLKCEGQGSLVYCSPWSADGIILFFLLAE